MTIPRALRLPLAAAFVLLGSAVGLRAQPLMATWLLLNQSSQETILVTDATEKEKLVKAGWLINGQGALALNPAADNAGVHRLVISNATGNDRVFAITDEEIAACLKAGYHEEGTLGQAATAQLKPAMIPVHRFTRNEKHLWLIGTSARPWAEKNGWKFGGVAFWIWPATQ